jgi:hypothetical protein
MSDPLMTAQELCQALGISKSWYAVLKKAGKLRQFEPPRLLDVTGGRGPHRRYIKARVDAYLRGESLTRIGTGARRSA